MGRLGFVSRSKASYYKCNTRDCQGMRRLAIGSGRYNGKWRTYEDSNDTEEVTYLPEVAPDTTEWALWSFSHKYLNIGIAGYRR